MQFLNPRTDLAFKKIFGSDQSKDILLSFLNAVLTLSSPIADVTIVDPYQAPKVVGMKESAVDVRAVDENGRQFIIEMQVLNVNGFEKRVLYNACKAYAGQISKGEDYPKLSDVIALTITDFTMFPQRPDGISTFRLKADDGGLYSDDLELVFIELPKFHGEEADLATMDLKDKWLFFLKHAKDLSIVPDSLQQIPSFAHAFAIANRAALTPAEDDEQTRREYYIFQHKEMARMRDEANKEIAQSRDEALAMHDKTMAMHDKTMAMHDETMAMREKALAMQDEAMAIREKALAMQDDLVQTLAKGKADGKSEGKAEGLAEGAHQAAVTIAKSLLPLIPDDAAIAAVTALTVAEIAVLRRNQDG
jgi:predicted transposase/invertase (TIGR01784 family)